MDFEDRFYVSLPYILKVCGGIAITLLIVGYVIFQARHLISGPTITLLQDFPTTLATSSVSIRGKATNIISLSLNGRPIFTTDEGVFEEVVVLPVGYTVVTIEAADRYGATTRLERHVLRTAPE
ncbi:MAG: Glucodextranase, domain [Candidatus Parcubacteria bacterium]|jgi:hypothetical protein